MTVRVNIGERDACNKKEVLLDKVFNCPKPDVSSRSIPVSPPYMGGAHQQMKVLQAFASSLACCADTQTKSVSVAPSAQHLPALFASDDGYCDFSCLSLFPCCHQTLEATTTSKAETWQLVAEKLQSPMRLHKEGITQLPPTLLHNISCSFQRMIKKCFQAKSQHIKSSMVDGHYEQEPSNKNQPFQRSPLRLKNAVLNIETRPSEACSGSEHNLVAPLILKCKFKFVNDHQEILVNLHAPGAVSGTFGAHVREYSREHLLEKVTLNIDTEYLARVMIRHAKVIVKETHCRRSARVHRYRRGSLPTIDEDETFRDEENELVGSEESENTIYLLHPQRRNSFCEEALGTSPRTPKAVSVEIDKPMAGKAA